MGRSKEHNQDVKKTTVNYYKSGLPLGSISKQLNIIPRASVRTIIQKYKTLLTTATLPRCSGRKRKLTVANERLVVRKVRINPKSGAKLKGGYGGVTHPPNSRFRRAQGKFAGQKCGI